MRSRSPWLLYAVTLASAGYFAFAWLVMLMRDINRIERRIVFPTNVIAWGIGLSVAGYLCIIFALLTLDPPPEWLIRLGLFAMILFVALCVVSILLLVFVARCIARASGVKFRYRDALIIIVLSLLWFLSFPIVQRRLNELIEGRVGRDLEN